MIIVIISIIIILIIIVFLFMGKKPYEHKNIKTEELGKYFNILYNRGYNNGFMIIKSNKKGRNEFLQFKKYIIKNNIILELGFPKAKWSETFYLELQNMLKINNIDFNVIEKSKENLLEFITVNCNNIDLCIFLVNEIFMKIFHFENNDLYFRIKYYGVSPKDEIIR